MKVQDCELPEHLKYDKDYGWVEVEDGTAAVGVTELGMKKAQEAAFVELPQEGDQFEKGEEYAVIEAAKWTGELKIPLSGEVIEVNEDLIVDPGKLNRDPYENWMVKIEIENKQELEELMDVKEAGEFYGGK